MDFAGFKASGDMTHVDIKPGISIQTAAIDLVAEAQRSGLTLETTYRGIWLVVAPTTAVSDVIDFFDAAVAAQAEQPADS